MKNYLRIVWLLLSCVIGGIVCAGSAAAQAATDSDGDGLSDFWSVKIGSAPQYNLSWRAYLNKRGTLRNLGTYGKVGVALAPAKWVTSKSTKLAAVSKNSDDALELSVSGQSETLQLGAAGDYFVSGADFDGNGIADAAAVSFDSGVAHWTVWYNPFMNGGLSGSAEAAVEFGVSGDVPFFARVSGQHDWFGMYHASSQGVEVKFFDPQTQTQQSFTLSASLRNYSLIGPVQRSDGTDDLVISSASKTATTIRRVTLAGRVGRGIKVAATGVVVIGNFDKARSGEEVAISNRDGYNILVGSSVKRRKISSAIASLIPVDEINVNLFSDGSSSSSSSSVAAGSCKNWSVNDGVRTGFVWKPNSDTTYYAVAVMPGKLYGKISEVDVYKSDGTYIKQLTNFGCGNPDPYGMRCNYKDFKLTGADYKRLYGSIIVWAKLKDGGCAKFQLSDPSKRVD